MKKRLMILGASYTQNPLYQAARDLGCKTIAASIPGNYPGFLLADETAEVDISDPEAVLAAARQMNIDAIATCGLDLGMRSIGLVCERLHLPGPGEAAARRASNKREMKEALTRAGVKTARFACIEGPADLARALEKFSFPVILKATDQMGSRGIYRCDSEEEVWKNFPLTMASTKQPYCLLEEFIVGEIFGVEAMIQNGEMVYMLPNNITPFFGATPSPIGHSVPYEYQSTLGKQIEEQVRLAVNALGLDNCPVNCDFIRRGDEVFIVELTGRSGATGLSEMVGLYYGLNYYEMIVRLAMGEDVRPCFAKAAGSSAVLTQTLISDKSGRLKSLSVMPQEDPQVIELSFNVQPGDEIRRYTNGRDRIGQMIVTGADLEDCKKRYEQTMKRVHMEIE